MKEFKGIWIPYEILTDIKLNDKEKIVYSMILYLSKEKQCIMSNSYISELLSITKIQSSRIINSLKKKGYIKVEMIYKENSKEIAIRKVVPICKYDNTYKQINIQPINKDVKELNIRIIGNVIMKEIIVILTGQVYMLIDSKNKLDIKFSES